MTVASDVSSAQPEESASQPLENTRVSIAQVVDGLPDLHWFCNTHRNLCRNNQYLELYGYLNPLRSKMLQIVDETGTEWLYRQQDNELRQSPVFDRERCLAMILCNGQKPNPVIREICAEHDIALIRTSASGEVVDNFLLSQLPRLLSPRCNKHGVFVAVMNTGVLITGASGVGKSEVALDLVQRGHQLIADDSVILQCRDGDELTGTCAPGLKGYLEIRGLGIINVEKMFGPAGILDSYPLQLIINLRDATNREIRNLDRLQPSLESIRILGVTVPCLNMLVAPGRNLSVLVEAATRDHLLRRSGVDSSVDFIHRHDEMMGITGTPSTSKPD